MGLADAVNRAARAVSMRAWSPRRRILALFAGCLVAFLWPGLTTRGYYSSANLLLGHFPWRSETPLPARAAMNPLLTDQPTQFIVWTGFAGDEVRRGRAPLWNPWAAGGRPLLGNSQSAVLSPFNLGWYAFGPRVGPLWSAALRLACVGWGMWVLARRLSLGRVGAAIAAVGVMFSAPIVVGLAHPHGAAYTVLPWLLVGAHALAARPGPRAAAGTALAVALIFVAGHPETTFHMLVATALWGAWLLVGAASRRTATVGWAVVGVGAGVLLSAAHLLPFLEYLLQSDAWATRAGPAGHPHPPLPAVGLLAWVLPNVFGHPQHEPFWLAGTSFQAIAVYGGVWLPLLALASLRHRGRPSALVGLGLVGLLCALAVYGCPPFPWLLRRLPLFRSALNERLLMVTVCTVGLFAGLAADRWNAKAPSRRVTGAVAGAALVLLLAAGASRFYSFGPASLAPSLLRAGLALAAGAAVVSLGLGLRPLVLVAALDVISWGYRFNPVTPPDQYYPTTSFIASLQAELAGRPQRRMLARGYLFPAETPMQYGIRDVKGYDALEPRRLARYLDLAADADRDLSEGVPVHRRIPLMSAYRSPLLDAVAAAVIVSDQPLSERQFALLAAAPGIYAYRNARALPRARLAAAAEALPSEDAVARRLARPDHDPRTVTLLEGPPLPHPVDGAGTVRFLTDEPTLVRIEVEAAGDALLVLADTAFPGWEATLDEDPARMWIADLAFRAVPVPAGRHVVTFRYRPRSWRVGLALTGLGLLGVAGLWALPRRRPSSARAVG